MIGNLCKFDTGKNNLEYRCEMIPICFNVSIDLVLSLNLRSKNITTIKLIVSVIL